MAYLSGNIVRRKCPVLVGFKKSGEATLIRCGRWSCPYCSRRNARKWGKRTYQHIHDKGGNWQMLTLTFGSKYKSPAQAFAVLPKLWDSLRKEFQRKTDSGWQFLAFVEGQTETRDGMPHFHVMTNRTLESWVGKRGYITQHNLHNWAVMRGFGFEVDLKQVVDKEAAFYVSKYASKGDPSMPKNFRRVRACRSWSKLERDIERKLIVPSKGESLIHFMMRLNDLTNVDIDTLYERWSKAQDELKLLNEDNDG